MAQETMGTRLLVPLDEVSATGQQFRAQAPQIEEQVRAPLQATEQTHGLGWTGQAREQYLTLHQRLMPALEHVETRVGTFGTQLGHHASYYAVLNALHFGGTPGAPAVEGGLEPTEDERVAGTPSEDLAKAIKAKTGVALPPGKAAHHIVPYAKNLPPSAIAARNILVKYHIDLNDADNGIYLPYDPTLYPGRKYYHKGKGQPDLHTYAYCDEVLARLQRVDKAGATDKDIRAVLQQIGKELDACTFPI